MSSELPPGLGDLERVNQLLIEGTGPNIIVRLARVAARVCLERVTKEEYFQEYDAVATPLLTHIAYAQEKLECVDLVTVLTELPNGRKETAFFLGDKIQQETKHQTQEYISLFKTALLELLNIARPDEEDKNNQEADEYTEGAEGFIRQVAENRASASMLSSLVKVIRGS